MSDENQAYLIRSDMPNPYDDTILCLARNLTSETAEEIETRADFLKWLDPDYQMRRNLEKTL